MHIWIMTIGSSDILLDSDRINKDKGRSEKQRSDKIWQYWYTEDLRDDHYDIQFVPKTIFKDKEESYRVPPRILGEVFQSSDDKIKDEIWNHLTFPLLNNFANEIENYPIPEAIILLLTDQSNIFQDDRQRGKIRSPYWLDTCELKPILDRYFKERFPEISCEWVILTPTSQEQGLDDWNSVLKLVREKFHSLTINGEKIRVESNENVYVSHQAGTPAISSAIQFISLARFGDRVKFLVSNEYNRELTDVLPSSNYLIALKQQQATKLLERHDYTAIKDIYSKYLNPEDNILLEAAIQWNFAHFTKSGSVINKGKKSKNLGFIEILVEHPKFAHLDADSIENEKWWWVAYEAAYLGFIRLIQGNTVEAMFHSFRSVEGLLKSWADRSYPGEITKTKHPRFQENERWDRNLHSYGVDLYFFLDLKKDIDKDENFDIWIFGNKVFGRRNDIFHNIKGLNNEEDVFEMWRSPNESKWTVNPRERWKARILNCLNFIVGGDLQSEFSSLEGASLMYKVHQELEKTIAHL